MIIPCKNFAVEIFTCKLWRNALILGQSGGLLKIWFITYTSTVNEMSREDKHRLFKLLEILKLNDSELCKGVGN
ncbi:MAG: hypothetical protein FWE27_09185, partial [Defluviitaleaceae bacterium]|nr:hypothetical protein [Defluviitaleaceae bacterium]